MTKAGGMNLIFVNRSTDISHNINFTANRKYYLKKQVVLTSNELNDDNTPSESDKVTPEIKIVNSADVFSLYTVSPFTVTVLYLEPQKCSDDNSRIIELSTDGTAHDSKLCITASLQSDSPLSGAETLCLMVPEPDCDETGINPEDIVWLGQKTSRENRAVFEVIMP